MLALLYDVHGNRAALDAVIADAEAAGARSYVVGGDVALFGPRPLDTIARLWALDADWIRGNAERWTARPDEAPEDEVVQSAIAACHEHLSGRLIDELASLPDRLDRNGVLYCHGSPPSDVRSFFPQPAPDEDELLAGVGAARVVFGHTHLPFARRATGGIELLNPGSVGMPFDGDPRAAYALVANDGAVEHRRVAYDHVRAAAELLEGFDAPFATVVARRIERARMDA